LLSRGFNYVGLRCDIGEGHDADFAPASLVNSCGVMWAANSSGSLAMSMADRLSVACPCLALKAHQS